MKYQINDILHDVRTTAKKIYIVRETLSYSYVLAVSEEEVLIGSEEVDLYFRKLYPEDQIKHYIVNLLSNLASFNLLTKQIVDQISQSFHTDCVALCKENGITYFLIS